MTIETADLKATPARVRRLAQLGYLDRAALESGLRLTGGIPDRQGWARFIDYLLLALGALFFVAGLFFFVAYNWEDLPRFARFGVLEAAIVVVAAIAQWSGLSRLGGKIAFGVSGVGEYRDQKELETEPDGSNELSRADLEAVAGASAATATCGP